MILLLCLRKFGHKISSCTDVCLLKFWVWGFTSNYPESHPDSIKFYSYVLLKGRFLYVFSFVFDLLLRIFLLFLALEVFLRRAICKRVPLSMRNINTNIILISSLDNFIYFIISFNKPTHFFIIASKSPIFSWTTLQIYSLTFLSSFMKYTLNG